MHCEYEPLARGGDMELGDLAKILALLRRRNDEDRIARVGASDAEHMGHESLLATLEGLLAGCPPEPITVGHRWEDGHERPV
jgi:hypothetical protein